MTIAAFDALPELLTPIEAREYLRLSRNGLPAEHTNWFSLIFYGDLATLAMELDKGANVYVEGSFDQRPMTDQQGRKRYAYEVTVQKFFRIGRASDGEARTAPTEHPSRREALNDEIDSSDQTVASVPWAI